MASIPRLPFLVLSLFGLSWAAHASDDFLPKEELDSDHALSLAYQTPHIDWARPYAGGQIKVLFLTKGMGTHPRECIELMQRFDIAGKAAFYENIIDTSDSHWHGGKSGEERLRALLDEPWDCFVFAGGIGPALLNNELQFRLLSRVTEGAGLVIVGPTDDRVLVAAHRIDAAWATAGVVGTAYTVGKGHGINIPNRPLIPFQEGWRAKDETWQECLGRAVLWAAGKQPKAALAIAGAPTVAFNAAKAFTVTCSGPTVGGNLKLRASLRRPTEDSLELPAQAITAGTPVQITLGDLSAGDYHLDVRVVGDAGVETWATQAFTVQATRKVAKLALDTTWAEIGGHLAGSVALDGAALPNEKVRVRLLDPQRRELAHQDLGATATFDFPVEAWLPMLVTVEAQVLSGSAEAANASVSFNVCKRGRDRFNFLMWDVPTGTLAPYAEQSLAEHGVTLQLGQGNPPAIVAANGISWVPYTTRITTAKDPNLGQQLKPEDWNDAQAVAKHTDELKKAYAPSRQHGVFVYSLGDENDTLGCTTGQQGLADYRIFLQESYPTIAALNASWGTAFTSWDEVGLAKPGDNEEEASRQAGCYPRWFDRQAFKSWNYLRYCQKHRQAFRELDPQAKTGFEGAGEFAKGDNLDAIVQGMDFWSPYPGTADEVAASISPRSMPRANWMGYTKDADSLLSKYWRMVMLGMDAVWWWRWDAIGRFHGWLAPDLQPYPAVQEILDDTRLVREGVGDLMLRSERPHDGIAILYSYPSVFATRIGEPDGIYEPAHKRAIRILRDLGLKPQYVTDGMLRRDPAALKPYRTLLLIRADALGDAETAAIRAFAAAGGNVFSDMRPGTFDGHCKPRTSGALDTLFGVAGPAATAGSRHLGTDAGLAAGATAQRAADGSPLRIANGTCELLNTDLRSQPGEDALRGFLAAHGHAARYAIAGADGKRPEGLWVERWQNGGIEILGVLAADVHLGEHTMTKENLNDPRSLAVTISLPEAKAVYDLRSGKALGQVTTLTTTLRPNRVNLFAILPNAAAAPQWTAPAAAAVAPGSVLRLPLVAPGSPGLRPFRITVAVDGRDLPWAAQTVLVGADGTTVVQPIAFNDPAGTWRFTAHDQLTGLTATADVHIGGK